MARQFVPPAGGMPLGDSGDEIDLVANGVEDVLADERARRRNVVAEAAAQR